jgi:hypothetical protein
LAVVDAILKIGFLSGAEVDEVIADAVAAKAIDEEKSRRLDWQRRCESAGHFPNH